MYLQLLKTVLPLARQVEVPLGSQTATSKKH